MTAVRVRTAVASIALWLAGSFAANAAVLANCGFSGGGGDGLARAFYLSLFPGDTVDTVTLGHRSTIPGERTIRLTMRLNNYAGPVLAVAETTTQVDNDMSPTIFRFDGRAVPPGFLLAFTQEVVAGNTSVLYDTGDDTPAACSNITQTQGSTAPLDDFRRASVGIMVTGSSADLTNVTTFGCPFDPQFETQSIAGVGLVVESYPGISLRTVRLRLLTNTFSIKSVQLTARLDRFDGPLVGTAIHVMDPNVSVPSALFNFGSLPVPGGARLTFVLTQLSGDGTISYDKGFGSCDDVYERFDTTVPPIQPRGGSVGITITGDVGSATPIAAVEYFHAGFGHYFMTAQADEIAGLDGGAYGGAFTRTGREFDIFDGPVAGAVPVCRFFTVTFAPKSSHFYTADADECAFVKENPDWQYEKVAFYVRRYNAGCPAGQVPVYRIYNNGMSGAPNHRYTTDLALYGTFVNTQGWAAEGIRFCAVP
ncbi:MAG: hypothetical protein ABI585_12805 [Betaproteobacteria bacterium]